MVDEKKKLIGIWGYPDQDILQKAKLEYPQNKVIDLDINYNHPESGVLPDAYCRIMRNIIDNAVFLKDSIDLIIA